MEKNTARLADLIGVAVIVLVMLLLISLLWAGRTLSHRLASRGWAVYSLPTCPACRLQDQILGDPHYGRRNVCGGRDQVGACPSLPAFPFWFNELTGEMREGVQTRAELREMAKMS